MAAVVGSVCRVSVIEDGGRLGAGSRGSFVGVVVEVMGFGVEVNGAASRALPHFGQASIVIVGVSPTSGADDKREHAKGEKEGANDRTDHSPGEGTVGQWSRPRRKHRAGGWPHAQKLLQHTSLQQRVHERRTGSRNSRCKMRKSSFLVVLGKRESLQLRFGFGIAGGGRPGACPQPRTKVG